MDRARAACARQERAQQEMRDKLYGWGLRTDQVEQAITQLIAEGFLNEQRFAEAYAVGRFRQKGWGRNKIRHGLRLRRISDPCIRLGLAAIDPGEYLERLQQEARRRSERERGTDAWMRRQRVLQHLVRRGFEPDLVADALAAVDGERPPSFP